MNGETSRIFPELSAEELEEKVALGWQTFASYRHTAFGERAAWLARAADILEREKEALGAMMTAEMGKTLRSAVEEAEKCATGCRYYAEHGEELLQDRAVATQASQSYVRYEPLGPVLAVMPWNFPFWQVFRFAAPALMAGNTCLLKHASNVPRCALAIEDIFLRAGFPPGAFQTLLVEPEAVAGLLADPRVAAATLTGSEKAGMAVAETAGRHLKKTVLELGGSDPFLVTPGADVELAAAAAAKARVVNNGQSCIAAKRFIVDATVYDRFTELFVRGMESLTVGDPMDPATDVGPLAAARIRDDLDAQVRRAVQAGARVLTGGQKPEGSGYFYPPTVLAGVERDSPIYREELFGPVAMLFRARGLGDAAALANDTPFGLGASVWTNDAAERDFLIRHIEAGQVFVNAPVASDPRLPFGGIKRSGYGRELGEFGIREFVNVKTIWIK